MQVTYTAAPYRPSSPLTGSEQVVYRGQNMVLRGQLSNLFYSAYTGSKNISEPLPRLAISGTVSFSPSSLTITGAGTSFLDELRTGQMFYADGDPLVVNNISSQTSLTVYRLPTVTAAGVTAYKTPIIFALDTKRASLIHGNATLTDKGNIIAVGDGELYLNGSVLSGDSLTASRTAQIAIYDSATMSYDVVPLGFAEVPVMANGDVSIIASGGVKNMSAGYYSFRVAYYSSTTDGYGNPTQTLLEAGMDGYHITAANSTIQIDFSGDVANRPTKATGYIIYGSAYAGSSDISRVNAIQGGWFEIVRVPFADLISNLYVFEYTDFDLGTLVTFDNDTPPDAEFISFFTNYINLISTDGAGVDSTGREDATSPGPLIAPQKADNIDAYPASYRAPTEKGETIIGFLNAAGRMFPMTPNTLQASTPTGLPTSPFTLRPFWQRGFATPYNLTFIDDTLYGFTTKGPYRSIATGDSADESNLFAAGVDAQMAMWSPAYVFVAFDPINSAVCYFHSACSQNDEGYWESEVYLYSLKINDWLPRVLLTDDTRDMIVTGAATVHNALYFVAGGRRESAGDQFDTFEFDSPNGEDVPYYLAFSYQDGGVELHPKVLNRIRPKGKFTSAKVQVYGVAPDSDIDVTDLETGDNPLFEIDLDDSTSVKSYEAFKRRSKNMMMYTTRIEGTSSADSVEDADQFHEIALNIEIAGQIR